MSRILMLVQSSVLDDARVRREVEALTTDGHEIVIVGSKPPAGDQPPLPAVIRFVSTGSSESPRPGGSFYRTIRWLLLPEYRVLQQRRFQRAAAKLASAETFDIVHCHDYPTLAVGLKLAGNRPVVYDSHECWNGRLRHGRPEPIRRWRQLRQERRLAGRAKVVLTVSDELKQWIDHHLHPKQTKVVRNTFDTTGPLPSLPELPRGLVYAGRISPGRDLATAFSASLPDNIALTLVGPLQPGFMIPSSARYEGHSSIDNVPGIMVAAGLALVSLEDTCPNHRMALPNKIFHAVASGIPVVAADLPAIRRVVNEHGIGTLYEPGNPASLAAAVRLAIEMYAEFCQNVVIARQHLSWNVDGERLQTIYRGLRR